MKKIFLFISLLALSSYSFAHSEEYKIIGNKQNKISSFDHFFSFYIGKNHFSSRKKFDSFSIYREIKINKGNLYIKNGGKIDNLGKFIQESEINTLIEKYETTNPEIYSSFNNGVCIETVDHFKINKTFSKFSKNDIEYYRKIFNSGIENIVGYVIYQIIPDIKFYTLVIPGETSIFYTGNGQTYKLIENKSSNSFKYELNVTNVPKDFLLYSDGKEFSLEVGGNNEMSISYCP